MGKQCMKASNELLVKRAVVQRFKSMTATAVYQRRRVALSVEK